MTTSDKIITMRGLLLTAVEQLIMLDDTEGANAACMEEYNRRIREIGRMASTLFGEDYWNMPLTIGLPPLCREKAEKLIRLIEELEFDKMPMDRIFDGLHP